MDNLKIMEDACLSTYKIKVDNKLNLEPEVWLELAIKKRLYTLDNSGFTRDDDAREKMEKLTNEEILLTLVKNSIKSYDYNLRNGVDSVRCDKSVNDLLSVRFGLENLIMTLDETTQMVRNGLIDKNGFDNYFKNLLDELIRMFSKQDRVQNMNSIENFQVLPAKFNYEKVKEYNDRLNKLKSNITR